MTIEQFAEAQGLPKITRYTLPNKSHVYRLRDTDSDEAEGLPVFAIDTIDSYRLATPQETFLIMDQIYGKND